MGNSYIAFQENAFASLMCKTAAIFFGLTVSTSLFQDQHESDFPYS